MVDQIKVFAINGDRTTIPDNDPSLVSYDKGFTASYSGAGATNYPEREVINEAYYRITSTLEDYQTHGIPEYFSGKTYPVGALVRDPANGKIYQSKVASNTAALTIAANWALFNASDFASLSLGGSFNATPTAPSIWISSFGSNVFNNRMPNWFDVKSLTDYYFSTPTVQFSGKAAASPALNSNDTSIATTAWTKNQGYLAATTYNDDFKYLFTTYPKRPSGLTPTAGGDWATGSPNEVYAHPCIAVNQYADYAVPMLNLGVNGVTGAPGSIGSLQLEYHHYVDNCTLRFRSYATGASPEVTSWKYFITSYSYQPTLQFGETIVTNQNFKQNLINMGDNIPAGMLMPFHPSYPAPNPALWAKCDGSDPRAPNLTDSAIVQGGGLIPLGGFGGDNNAQVISHTHTIQNIPAGTANSDGRVNVAGSYPGAGVFLPQNTASTTTWRASDVPTTSTGVDGTGKNMQKSWGANWYLKVAN